MITSSAKKKLARLKMPEKKSKDLALMDMDDDSELSDLHDDGSHDSSDMGRDLGNEDSGATAEELDQEQGKGDIGDHGGKSDEEDMMESMKEDEDNETPEEEAEESPEDEKLEEELGIEKHPQHDLSYCSDDDLISELKKRGLLDELEHGDKGLMGHSDQDDQDMYS